MIKINQLSKKYGSIEAVKNISLNIGENELFGFLGPNGAGKTTTLKMVSGLLEPDSGSVLVNGINIQENPSRAKQDIGYIPDTPYLYEKLSGYEFLQFVGLLYGLTSSDIETQIKRYESRFNYSAWIRDRMETYSHGMRQKIIFTAAFLHHPKVLIVDEPMVGLDPSSIRIVKKLLKEKCANGMTILMSTHTLEIAQEICTTVAIIHQGEIKSQGNFDQLQQEAKIKGNLEEVFLTLTEEETDSGNS